MFYKMSDIKNELPARAWIGLFNKFFDTGRAGDIEEFSNLNLSDVLYFTTHDFCKQKNFGAKSLFMLEIALAKRGLKLLSNTHKKSKESIAKDALLYIYNKDPHAVHRFEAADMACEFKTVAERALKQMGAI